MFIYNDRTIKQNIEVIGDSNIRFKPTFPPQISKIDLRSISIFLKLILHYSP